MQRFLRGYGFRQGVWALATVMLVGFWAGLSSQAEASWYNPKNWFGSSETQATQPKEPPKQVSQARQSAKAEKSPAISSPQSQPSHLSNKNGAILFTEKGKIVIRLYEKEAPITVANFKKLVDKNFYDAPGMAFHRVVDDFVVQTGDPTGTGYGGSDKTIELEVKNRLSHDSIGVVAMARGPLPNSASSQFYITLAKQTSLDGKYAIFGEVIQGLAVLPTIKKGDSLYGVDLINVDSVVKESRKDYGKTKSSWNPF